MSTAAAQCWTAIIEHLHVVGMISKSEDERAAQIIADLRELEKDAFWTNGNVALLGQVLEAMTVVRDAYNAETPQQARAWQVAQFEASLTPLTPPARA